MKIRLFLFIVAVFSSLKLIAQEKAPKLVIGIVVDQMRYDYLDRFWNDFGEDGFKKLVKEGFSCKNVNYNFKPTYTGPGHASIFTGTTPSVHGIVGNHWYSKEKAEVVYCVSDKDENGALFYSPNKMLVESLADKIRQHSNYKGKSFGVSLKDRGAILAAGQSANGAYWFNSKLGKWESSSYYESFKPLWLKKFNETDFFTTYLKNNWELTSDLANYDESAEDQNEFEKSFVKDGKTVFPYNLSELFKERGWDLLKSVPSGNQMTVDLATSIIKSEELGKDQHLDFLSLSLSSTDYIGHQFGVQSVEVQDAYVKLDLTLAAFISFLNSNIGKENYILFLSSDHGASMPTAYLESKKMPNGYINQKKIKTELEGVLDDQFGAANWITSMMNLNIYFNDTTLSKEQYDRMEVLTFSQKWLSQRAGIKAAFLKEDLLKNTGDGFFKMVSLGVNDLSSGDIILLEEANWTSYSSKGSTHGSPYKYDTHIPLLIYGNQIHHGESSKEYDVIDIAPTIAMLSKMGFPNQSTGKLIKELFIKRGKADKTH